MASTRPGSVFTTSAPETSRLRHRREELLVVLRAFHAFEQELDRFRGRHVAQEVAEEIHTVELELHVAGPLELLEDHFVHARASFDERRGNDRQRSTLIDVPSCPEESLRLVQRVRIDTA